MHTKKIRKVDIGKLANEGNNEIQQYKPNVPRVQKNVLSSNV